MTTAVDGPPPAVSLEQLQAECRYRMVVRAPGYAGREVGQKYPGRAGATREHLAFRHAPGADHVELFGVVPHCGKRGGGVPGAMITGGFGRPGTPLEGKLCL